MSVPEIIRSARLKAERTGSSRVALKHLPPEQIEELANATLDWLRLRPAKPSPDHPGWIQVSASQSAVLSMWVADQNLSDEEQKCLRPLRREIYDLLDERGLIEKPPGQGTSVQVSPADGQLASPRLVTRENLGAWMVKCNPKVWDLQGFLDADWAFIENWSVQENYRSSLMAPGDLVFFWVTGPDRQALTPGIWGVGHVVAPCDWLLHQADDGDEPADDGYWLDQDAEQRATYFVPVDIPLLDEPIPRAKILADPRLANLEILRSPQMGNPQYVAPAEAQALLELVGGAPEVPEALPDEIVIASSGAGFGDPVKNAVVERRAMEAATDYLQTGGWRCEDVSLQKRGWDITASLDRRERHVEVKGVTGAAPVVLLTRNEIATAESDPDWCLLVVTRVLSKQSIHEFSASDAVVASKPYVYRADLR